MRNLLFVLSFDGTCYHGWQSQKNALSIQDTVRQAFWRVTGESAVLSGCSRTDAGVHAKMFCFSVKTASSVPANRFVYALNTYLPFDIVATRCMEVPEDFNARFSCVKKEYIYQIHNAPFRNPFYQNRAFHESAPIDEKLLNRAARNFVGIHDFTAFCGAGSDVKSKVRTVYRSEVSRRGALVEFYVEADGFLYNMVRIMAGTLLYVARGKIGVQDIPDIIGSRERQRAGITAPPQGLYLNKVTYEFEL